jgi:hypothetical protein
MPSKIFLTITEGLNLHKMGKEDIISFLRDIFPVKFPDIKIISTTEAKINKYNTFPEKNKHVRL